MDGGGEEGGGYEEVLCELLIKLIACITSTTTDQSYPVHRSNRSSNSSCFIPLSHSGGRQGLEERMEEGGKMEERKDSDKEFWL